MALSPPPATPDVIRAWFRIRTMLGWLGLALPGVLILGGWASQGGIEPSLSDYYHTLMRDAFVGVLTAMGLFLIAYPGHGTGQAKDQGRLEDHIATLTGVAALAVAYFPNEVRTNANLLGSVTQQALGYRIAAGVHYAAAILFLCGLAALCLRRFARDGGAGRRLYRACGTVILILAAVVIAASALRLTGGPLSEPVERTGTILWAEAGAVWTFALAWLARGREEARALSGPPAP